MAAAAAAQEQQSWRSKCIERWELKEIPAAWYKDSVALKDYYEKLSLGQDETWKRYYEFRQKSCGDSEDIIEDEDEDDPYDENGGLQKKANQHLKSSAASSGPGGLLLAVHTCCTLLDTCWNDCDDLRSCSFKGVVFSPFALPRAIRMKHRYHNRSRYYSVEYFCCWSFQLVRFDGVAFGDEIQQRLAKKFPGDISGPSVLFQHETPTAGFEDLCSTSLLDPPNVHGLDNNDLWDAIYDIQKENLNPTTTRRFRSWLFGSACLACREMLGDWGLLALLFAACGSDAASGPLTGDVGYTWPGWRNGSKTREVLKQEGCDWDEEEGLRVSWLEHASRSAAGALRPIDAYYEPYDLLASQFACGCMQKLGFVCKCMDSFEIFGYVYMHK